MSEGLESDVQPIEVSTSEQMLQGLEAADNPPPVADPVVSETGGINPAWESALNRVPRVYHDALAEEFRKWDTAANDRITSVQSRYKPYTEFVDNSIDPTMLKQSVELLNVFQNDPKSIYDFLKTQYDGQPSGQGQQDSDEFDLGVEEETLDPRQAQLERQMQQVMSQMEAANATKLQQEGDMWLAGRQAELTAKHSNIGVELDWDYIMTRALLKNQQGMKDNNLAIEMATQEFVEHVNRIRSIPSAGASAPRVMPASGGVPSSAVNIRKLGDQGRKDLVLEMMNALDKEDG